MTLGTIEDRQTHRPHTDIDPFHPMPVDTRYLTTYLWVDSVSSNRPLPANIEVTHLRALPHARDQGSFRSPGLINWSESDVQLPAPLRFLKTYRHLKRHDLLSKGLILLTRWWHMVY